MKIKVYLNGINKLDINIPNYTNTGISKTLIIQNYESLNIWRKKIDINNILLIYIGGKDSVLSTLQFPYILNNHNDKFEISNYNILKIKNTTLDYNYQNIYNLSITYGPVNNDITLMVYKDLDTITPMTYEFTGPDKILYKGNVHSTEGIESAQSVGNSKLSCI